MESKLKLVSHRLEELLARNNKLAGRLIDSTTRIKQLAEQNSYLQKSARVSRDIHRQRISDLRGHIAKGKFTFNASRMAKQSPNMEGTLANVSRMLIEAQERERARIARELHDDISQRLALLSVGIEQASADLIGDFYFEAGHRLRELQEQAKGIATDIHMLAHELHSSSLEYLGLVPAVRKFAADVTKRHGLQIDFKADGVQGALPAEISLCLFRIVQEGLHNAVRHSGAESVQVRLQETPSQIRLSISDAGKGFDFATLANGQGLGLAGMRERVRLLGGRIVIESQPTLGTCVQVWVPLHRSPRPPQSDDRIESKIACIRPERGWLM